MWIFVAKFSMLVHHGGHPADMISVAAVQRTRSTSSGKGNKRDKQLQSIQGKNACNRYEKQTSTRLTAVWVSKREIFVQSPDIQEGSLNAQSAC
jgi:hypothetical protein